MFLPAACFRAASAQKIPVPGAGNMRAGTGRDGSCVHGALIIFDHFGKCAADRNGQPVHVAVDEVSVADEADDAVAHKAEGGGDQHVTEDGLEASQYEARAGKPLLQTGPEIAFRPGDGDQIGEPGHDQVGEDHLADIDGVAGDAEEDARGEKCSCGDQAAEGQPQDQFYGLFPVFRSGNMSDDLYKGLFADGQEHL